MAYLQANQAFNYDDLDIHQLDRYGINTGLYRKTFVRTGFLDLVYEDRFVAYWQEPKHPVILSIFAGMNITEEPLSSTINGGVVTAYFEQEERTSSFIWGIEQILIPATELYGVAMTPDTGDDFNLYQLILSEADTMVFSNASDLIRSFSGNDMIKGYGGNDFLDGGAGTDTAWFQGMRGNYTITKTGDVRTITDFFITRDGQDTLQDIERLAFADGTLALDISGAAGQVYRLYQAAFARTPDNAGLKHNIGLADGGLTLDQLSSAFLASGEFQQKYGTNLSDTAFINALYRNVLGRDADPGGLAGWQARLSDGSWTRSGLLIGFSESPENVSFVGRTINDGIWLA